MSMPTELEFFSCIPRFTKKCFGTKNRDVNCEKLTYLSFGLLTKKRANETGGPLC